LKDDGKGGIEGGEPSVLDAAGFVRSAKCGEPSDLDPPPDDHTEFEELREMSREVYSQFAEDRGIKPPAPTGARRGRKKGLTKEQAARNYRSFALAYMDPTSPTYRNATETYLAMFPEYSRNDATRRGYKYAHHPMVKKEIARIQARTNAHAELTPGEYLQLLMQREKYYSERGEQGDATASTNLLKLIGQTGGFLVQRIEAKVDSKETVVHEIGEDTVNQLLETAERLRRLREPNPLPQIAAKAEVVEADYSIEEGG